MRIEEADLVIGSCRELIGNLLIFIHSNQAGLREQAWWRGAGYMTCLGHVWREKQGGDFFHQENKDADNAQDDGNPTHGDDDLSKLVEDATPGHTG